MREAREYELKFNIGAEGVDELLANRLVGAVRSERRLLSTYFDTRDEALRRHRVSLRVRHADDGLVQTLKAAPESRVDRLEWERASLDPQPDLRWLRKTPMKKLFRKKRLVSELRPQFTIDVDRATFEIRQDDTLVEGALDRGSVKAGGLGAAVSEFELELKEGRGKAVRKLARQLAKDLPLVLSLTSKAERGYALADSAFGEPIKDIPLRLRPKMTMAAAFEAIVQACLHVIIANAALIGGDKDVEAVHKTRIATRRMRAALRLFRPYLRKSRVRTVAADLRWIAGRLGEARDADVFLGKVKAGTANSRPTSGAPHLVDIMHRRQHRSRAGLREALGSARWRLMLLNLLDLSTRGVRRKLRDRRFHPLVAERLERQRAALGKAARDLPNLAAEARHDLRKDAKMLRYGLDFVLTEGKALPHRKRHLRLGEALEVLQDDLGRVQDEEALRSHLRRDVLGAGAGSQIDQHDLWRARPTAEHLIAKANAADPDLRGAAKAGRRIRKTALT